MKKFKLNSLTSIVITVAIMLSCGGYLIADDNEQPEVAQEPVIEQVEDEPEVAEEPVDTEEPEVVEDPVIDQGEGEPEITEETVDEETSEDIIEETVTVEEILDFDDFEYDNDYLAEQYILSEFSDGIQATYAYDYSANLNSHQRSLYNELRPSMVSIASGNMESTRFTVSDIVYTAEELGMSDISNTGEAGARAETLTQSLISSVKRALLNTCPYEMYWFDKTISTSMSYSIHYNLVNQTVTISGLVVAFPVAKSYRVNPEGTASDDMFRMNTQYGTSASAAAQNARNIIANGSSLTDYDRLLFYNDEICRLVDYNHPATAQGVPYGNPWQMIWVFDGDPSTTVVCEGYSKAFQYLCDNTLFSDSSIYAITVYGHADLNGASGGHMWNIVHIGDANYLVDVTNSDPNEAQNTGNRLFLVGATGSVESGYTVVLNTGNYFYQYEAGSVLVDYSEEALTLSSENYQSALSQPVFRGTAMQIRYEIGFQFFFELPEGVDYRECFVTFADDNNHIDSNRHYPLNTSSKVYMLRTYMAQVDISSIQMADKITPTLHYCVDGVWHTVDGIAHSAQDYLKWQLANMSSSSSDYQIVRNLIDYGYYAQKYLSGYHHWGIGTDYATIDTAARNYSTSDYERIQGSTSGYAIESHSLNNYFESTNYTLRFRDSISLVIYLDPIDDSLVLDENSFFIGRPVGDGVHYYVVDYTVTYSNGRYLITIPNINMSNLSYQYYIRYQGCNMTVSPLSYVYDMLRSDSASSDGKNLVCALYELGVACGMNV